MSTTTADRTVEAVKKIISINLGVSIADLKATDSLVADLDADSLDILEITMDIELEFGIEIDDEVERGFKTVGQIIDYVQTH
jgi:acyl carrier protein